MVIRIGHREAPGKEIENSLGSFREVLEMEIDMIEFDVHKCKTGELVIIHKGTAGMTQIGREFIEGQSYDELCKQLCNTEEKIPLLSEVLELINRKVKVNIEIKGFNLAHDISIVIRSFIERKGWTYDDFVVSSFIHKELAELMKIDDQINRSVCLGSLPIDHTEGLLVLEPYSVELSFDLVTKEFVQNAHKNKLMVFVWSVDDIEHMKRMEELGVDGIFTNYPQRI